MAKKNKASTQVDPMTAITHLLKTQNAMLEVQAAHGRRLDGVEEIVGSIADTDEARAKYVKRFGRGHRRVRVYLALNGVRDRNDIAKLLGMQGQNVDRELRELAKSRLVDLVEKNGRGSIYRKLAVDRKIGLSHELMEKFTLDKDGRPLK